MKGFRWWGGKLRQGLQDTFSARLDHLGKLFVRQCRRNISQPSNGGRTPSAPGEFPHKDTGELYKSIFWRKEGWSTLVVGATAMHALWLEFGRKGGKVIYPIRGQFLSWIDPHTNERIFARKVVLGDMAPRPFLQPTLDQQSLINKVLLANVKLELPRANK